MKAANEHQKPMPPNIVASSMPSADRNAESFPKNNPALEKAPRKLGNTCSVVMPLAQCHCAYDDTLRSYHHKISSGTANSTPSAVARVGKPERARCNTSARSGTSANTATGLARYANV